MSFYQDWLTSALLSLGVCISLFGLLLLCFPVYSIQLGNRLNRWISTDAFFNKLDKPHYRERFFYRWHKPLGILLTISSLYIFFIFLFQVNINNAASALPLFGDREVSLWFYEALRYFFIATSLLTLVMGLLIVVRPSILKKMEEKANHWVGVDKPLETLNNRYEIPENILPGNVRLFGSCVFLGGLYIILSLSGLIF